MLSPNSDPSVALPLSVAVTHSPARPELAKQVRRSGVRRTRRLAAVLFCAGLLGLELGAWKLPPSGQEKHATEEAVASTEEAAITRIAQASLANSKHPLLTNQAREAQQKIEQSEARAQATLDTLHELRAKRIRLLYLFCGIGTLLIVLGALVRLSA